LGVTVFCTKHAVEQISFVKLTRLEEKLDLLPAQKLAHSSLVILLDAVAEFVRARKKVPSVWQFEKEYGPTRRTTEGIEACGSGVVAR
jgi:hypothetical protein